MTVRINKDAINLREKLSQLDKPSGLVGEELLRADTSADAREALNLEEHLFEDFESTGIDDNATSTKVTVSDSGVDVDGTVTADGLTVANTTPKITITDTDTGADHEISGSSSAGSLFIESDKNSNNLGGAMQFKTQGLRRFDVENSTGDIRFYEDTGTTAKFVWDASAESLGIGNAPMSSRSGLYLAGTNKIVQIGNDNGGQTATMGALTTRSTGVNDYGCYFGYDSFYDHSNGKWKPLRGTLGRKFIQHYSYHQGKYRLRYLNQVQSEWDDSAWDDLVTLDVVTGNLGIGTASPERPLHIASATPYIVFEETDASQKFSLGSGGGKFFLYDETDSAQRLTVDSSGNVGIGTASPISIGGHSGVLTLYGSNATALVLQDSTSRKDLRLDNGDLSFRNSSGDTHLMVKDDGNVGIGTSSPSEKLDVRGAVNGTHAIFTGQAGRGLVIGTQNTLNNDDGVSYDAQTSSGKHLFKTNGAERARIDSSGKLLVNTSSNLTYFGDAKLQVKTTTNQWGGAFESSSTSSSQGCIALIATTSTPSLARFHVAGSIVGSITSNGTTTAYNTTSDERLKENIVDTTHSVNIDDIKVREYDWKADGSHQRFGFIAQELETVYPEAVHSPEDEDEMKSVDYSKFVPLLVKEIQTLKARIEELEK